MSVDDLAPQEVKDKWKKNEENALKQSTIKDEDVWIIVKSNRGEE